MMIERLQLFRKHSKSLPDRVLVFRDGVSEVCVLSYHSALCFVHDERSN